MSKKLTVLLKTESSEVSVSIPLSYAADLNLNLARGRAAKLTSLLTATASSAAVVKRTVKRERPARLARPRTAAESTFP